MKSLKFASFSFVVFFLGCGSGQNTQIQTFTIPCGSRQVNVEMRVTERQRSQAGVEKFALLLSGSPGTDFLTSGYGSGPNHRDILGRLTAEGFRTVEIRYPDRGFYYQCAYQGLPSVQNHIGQLYDRAVQALRFDPNNQSHQLVSLGFSLGAIQSQVMRHILNKRIDKVALTGILMGDSNQGCLGGRTGRYDGMAWTAFMPLADVLTVSGVGCSQGDDYRSFDFNQMPYRNEGALGLFEGDRIQGFLPGNIRQADYILQARARSQNPTLFHRVPGCGHEVISCGGGPVVNAMIQFLTR